MVSGFGEPVPARLRETNFSLWEASLCLREANLHETNLGPQGTLWLAGSFRVPKGLREAKFTLQETHVGPGLPNVRNLTSLTTPTNRSTKTSLSVARFNLDPSCRAGT